MHGGAGDMSEKEDEQLIKRKNIGIDFKTKKQEEY